MKKRINVTKTSLPILDEYVEEIRSLWDSHWITNMGEKHSKLQTELEQFLGVDHLELFVNGHMSLEMTLQAMGLEGEVITTPFTFASTTHSIVRSGLEPVFCDINPDDFTINVEMIEDLITERTCAILPVHVYGNICNVEEIDRIAVENGLKVIYDAAHAFGETYKGTPIGRFGDVSCFSFHATKVFNTIEGGAAAYKDLKLGDKLHEMKNFGINNSEDVSSVGANAKMNEFCAAMGICNLRHIKDEIEKRKKAAERYQEILSDVSGIELQMKQADTEYNYSYYPVLFDEKVFGADRDKVVRVLANKGIGARKYFYPLTNAFSAYDGRFDPLQTPIALDISKRILALPLYADLTIEDVDYICEAVLTCRL